jgi:hypothetical protein
MDYGCIPCPKCGAIQGSELEPGQARKCDRCGQRFQVPGIKEAAKQELAEALRQSAEGEGPQAEARVVAVAGALLCGLGRSEVVEELETHGIPPLEAEQLLADARPLVRQGARASGLAMILFGALLLVGGGALTGATYLIRDLFGGWFTVAVGLLAIGGVLILVGTVKVFTGWNIH